LGPATRWRRGIIFLTEFAIKDNILLNIPPSELRFRIYKGFEFKGFFKP